MSKKFKITAEEKLVLKKRRKKQALAGKSVSETVVEIGNVLDAILNKKVMKLERQVDLLENNVEALKAFDSAHFSLLKARKDFNRLRNVLPNKLGNVAKMKRRKKVKK